MSEPSSLSLFVVFKANGEKSFYELHEYKKELVRSGAGFGKSMQMSVRQSSVRDHNYVDRCVNHNEFL